MTEPQKRLAIVGAVAIIAIVLLLLSKNRSGVSVQNSALPEFGDVIISGPNVTRTVFNIPGLDIGPEYERLSAIGACCSDCQRGSAPMNYAPANGGPTIVFNEGNSGPNVYNYFSPAPSPSYGGTWYNKP